MKTKNNDNQHSNGKKIVAALTTIVGAATIHNMKNSKAFTKELPRITKFAKILSEDIADKRLKNFDAKGIKDFAEKYKDIKDIDFHLNYETFKERYLDSNGEYTSDLDNAIASIHGIR